MGMMQIADVRSGIVYNVVEAPEGTDPKAIELIIPETDEAVSVTELTGAAYIGGAYQGGKFYPPQPHPSWIWDDENESWGAPIAYPQDGGLYTWDEPNQDWVELVLDDVPEGPAEG